MFSTPTQWQYSCYVFNVTRSAFAIIAIATCIAFSATPRPVTPLRFPADNMPLPQIMLWAWERPDDLRSVSPSEAGVAFLAGTIYAQENRADTSADAIVYRPRLQPLHLSEGVARVPVVRIETTRGPRTTDAVSTSSSHISEAQSARIVKFLTRVASSTNPPSLQIDFDATSSERHFYAQILTALRSRLGPAAHISITALASWCSGDAWLVNLPAGTIDEAVPMLFRMGTDATQIAATLANDGELRAPVCRTSAGISDDEPFSRAILSGQFAAALPSWKQKRIYIFHNGTWTENSALIDLGELEKWDAAFSPSR